MGKVVIRLGDDADLIIYEPSSVSATERTLVIASAIAQEFSGNTFLSPTTRNNSLPIKIGTSIYRIHYQFKVKRVMNALTAYSNAIHHIETNPHLYDGRLAKKAIETLRECYRNELK